MVSQPVEGETPVALRAPSVSPSTGDHSEWVDLTRGGPKQTIKVGQIRLSQPDVFKAHPLPVVRTSRFRKGDD